MITFVTSCPNHPEVVFARFDARDQAAAIHAWRKMVGKEVPTCPECGERQKSWSVEIPPPDETYGRENALRDAERAIHMCFPDRAELICSILLVRECGSVWRGATDTPCVRVAGHDGDHIDHEGTPWPVREEEPE